MPHYIILFEQKGKLEVVGDRTLYKTVEEAVKESKNSYSGEELSWVVIAEVVPKNKIQMSSVPYKKEGRKK